jgi:phage FluMu gp28-like protein
MPPRRSSRAPNRPPASPLDLLLPYQRDWFNDRARFKIGLWARQTGKSFITAAEAVADCLSRKTTWVTLSAGERQALEWMVKAREWAEAFKAAVEEYQELRDHAEALLKSAEIRWPNGSRLIAIPANPDTARGYSANLTLDEFAFHERPDAIWRAIYPSVTNPLRGELRLRVVSTPNGLGNTFATLWHAENPLWSKHRVDIHDAVARGLPVDIEALRAGLADPEGWAQEYECQFLDAASILLPYDLIAKIESPEATTIAPPDYWASADPARAPRYLGIDFARRRDLTVCWTLEKIGDVLHTREVLELRNLDTPAQVEMLAPRIARAHRVCLDYTGPGVGLGDYLARQFGAWDPAKHTYGRVELVTFTNPVKVELFSKLRMACENLRLRIPAAREIREDLHAVQRVALAGGGVTYRAPHTADGHADRATALALALRAAAAGAGGAITDPSSILTGAHYLPRRYTPEYLAPVP